MERFEEISKLFDENNRNMMRPLITEMVFLEEQLDSLRKLPFIKVHPQNPELQKVTPAAKQYKELLQQYTNIIKIIGHASGSDSNDEESPLRKWINTRLGDSNAH